MGTFNVAQQIDVREKCANIDALYGPYNSVDEANEAIPSNRRVVGRTVAVIEENGVVEYWYKAGIEDSDLVHKISENVPKLEYTEDYPEGVAIRADVGDQLSVSVIFTSQSYGQCTLTVYKDGTQLKTIKTNKGTILVDLGTATTEGTSVYTITGVDSLTVPAPETLTFRAIVGGAAISSDFQHVIDSGLNTSSVIRVIYNASVADTSKTVKVYAEILDSNGDYAIDPLFNQGSGDSPYTLSSQAWDIGTLSIADSYTVNMYAYTGDTPTDTSDDNVTTHVSYAFELMDAGTFKMTSTKSDISVDTNTTIVIPFRIYSGTRMTLRAHGELLDSDGNTVSGYTLDREVASDVQNYWSVGKLSSIGDYTFRLWATTVDGADSPTIGRVYVNIYAYISQYVPTYSVVTNGLVAQFLADGKNNNNPSDVLGYWANTVQGSSVYFELNDLNYNTNGWKHVDETIPDENPDGEMMLKMTGDSYGRLKQMAGSSPASTDPDYYPMADLISPESTGFTAEIIFRTRCIGDLNTKVMTGHTGYGYNTSGFSASFDKITIGADGIQTKLDVAEDEWIHATMVIDRTVHTSVSDVQDYAPRKLMTLYINGSACASAIITDASFTNYGPVLLNSAMNTLTGNVDFFGSCEIKAIRFYNVPLRASQVVNNYIASIYDPEQQEWVNGRNEDALPIVRFIRNGDNETTFATLNTVHEKSQQKLVYVYSRVLYEPVEGDPIEWPYVNVQTQGTSSLVYPVKNYKITIYKDNTYEKKQKTDAFSSLGWQDENKFTLKCDYMEAAHLNNTPSCTFYNEMIDDLVDSGSIATGWDEEGTTYTAANDERSQSRRDGMFDAIKGFPCLVYYYESESDYANGNGVYVGSYMFNIDKSGNSLGFKAPAVLDTDGETTINIENPRYDTTLYDAFSTSSTYSEGDCVTYEGLAYRAIEDIETAGEWNAEQWEAIDQYVKNVCQSFEGVANGSDTAGCFYSYEDWKTSHYAEYCTSAYGYYLNEYTGDDPLELDEFIQYYSIDHPTEKYRAGEQKEGFFNDGGYLYQKEPFITAEAKFADEYDYFASDFEARYDYDDLEEGAREFWGDSTTGLKRMIDWVSSTSATAGTDTDTFKSEFDDYFNFKYCALYFLQMIVFGQVDNAGKNSMWDTWDGLHWMPRPYDLDTMAGLNNTGYESIDPDAELNSVLSPLRVYNHSSGTASYSENVAEDADARYQAYNTRNSKFWIAFATSFKDEIAELYGTLRNSGTYSIESIMEFFKSMTSDIIGETYYNRDMTTKFYKLSNIDTFIDRMHGNRTQRFRAWMTQRIVFCDSFFNYSSATDSLNNIISLRSDASTGTETVSVSVGIKVYSPQYVRFEVGSGRDAIIEAYCSPNARYIDPITGNEMEGTLFTVPIPGGNKEMSISGSGNIKELVNLSALKASSLVLNYATRITSLDLTYSTKLTALSLANNAYLQTLDCTGATKLGTDASGAQLDLQNCENLKYVTLDNTKLTSVLFASGGNLKEISLVNTTITAVSLDSLHFLTSVDVTNCSNIISYSVTNCPKIESIAADSLPLTTVVITDCSGLTSLSLQSDNNISSLTIARCPNISYMNFANSRSASLVTLDLTTLYGLTSLDISGSTVETIKFPKYESSSSTELWGGNFTTFTVGSSGIKYIQYGETVSTCIDMEQMTGLTSLSFQSCVNIESIINLDFTGSCSSMFNGCTSLVSIQGELTCNGSAANIFQNCYLLSDISNLTFNFGNCTSLATAFYRCPWVTYEEIKRVLDSCGELLTSLSSMCYDKDYGVSYTSSQTEYTTVPAYFFGNCKHVTNINSVFYAAGIKVLSGNAFYDEDYNLGLPLCTSASLAFGSNTALQSFTTDLMKMLPLLQNAAGMFEACSGLIVTLPSDFFDPDTEAGSLVTNTKSMFYGCSNLVIPMSSRGTLLAPLTKLTNASHMFGSCTKCTGAIQEGFFASNTKLTNICGIFANTGISGIPGSGSLFRASGDTSTNFTSLTNISSMFSGCTSLYATPNADLFAGCARVTNAGEATTETSTAGRSIKLYGMFYNCTHVTAFSKDLFIAMPLVQSLSGFFYGCTGLVSQSGGGFDAEILNTNAYLTNVNDMFRGCTSLTISCVPQLFTACKSRLVYASALFYGCTGISDIDPDLFSYATRLASVSYAFYGCTSLSFTMQNMLLFVGCTSLQSTAFMFGNCTGISGSVPVALFNSCRSTLNNVSSMFYGCISLDGTIGIGNEDTTETSSSSFQPGLLAECLNLTTAANMFYNCYNITGAIPWDIFWTRSDDYLYSQLTTISYMFYGCAFNTPTEYDDVEYLFHPNMFIKLIGLTTMAGVFAKSSSTPNRDSWSAAYPVHANAFDGQYFLTTIESIFTRCNGLGGAIPNRWFINSVTNITNACGAFAYTKITGVSTSFLRASDTTANSKLAKVKNMFYNCSQITASLPAMYSTSLYRKIDYSDSENAINGFAHGCTSALNYSDFQSAEPVGAWVMNTNY